MYSRLFMPWMASSWAVALLLVFPILALVYESLHPAEEIFSHLMNTVMPTYIINTVLLIAGVGALSFLLAVPAAWLMAMCELPGRKYLQWALMLPLAMPAYIVAYIYTDLLEYAGPVQIFLRDVFGWSSPQEYWFPDIRTLGGAVVVITLSLYPYLYLLARTSFLEQSINLMQSARLLGKSPLQSFFKVSLPLARPAIAIGISLIAMETLADFATVNYFAVSTLTTAVYDTWLGYGSLNAAAKISSLMLLVIVLLLSMERYSRRKQKVFQKSMFHEQDVRFQLKGWRKWGASCYCWALVFAGFLLPFMILINYAIDYFAQSWTAEFLEYSINSFLVSGIVAVLALLIAILVGFYRRLDARPHSSLPARFCSLGYAVPGTVLAIGVLIPFGWLDIKVNDVVEAFGGEGPGLLFSGTMVAIIAGYLVRFSAIAVGSVESSFNKISPSLDMVSRTLGNSPGKMLKRVHIPLIRKGCLAALLLVFIESMKELPAALILRPFNFETLATYVFQYASDEMLEVAALPAIVIVLVGLVPLILLDRSLEQSH